METFTMTGFNSKRQAAWNKFAEKWQGIAKWKDPELNPIDTVQPTAWQWLDSGHFRKKIPKHSNPAEWNPLYKSPAAQPAQEPVAEFKKSDLVNYPLLTWKEDYVAKFGDKLYTTPPQRLWVGLTDEERLHLVDTHVGEVSPSYPLGNDDWINYATAVEAKLKEKNFD